MNKVIDLSTAGIHLPMVGACLAVGLLLLLAPRNERRSNHIVGCLLIVGATTCWAGHLRPLSGEPDMLVPWARQTLSACNFLYGPLLLFYVNAEFARRSKLVWIHLLPFLAILGWVLVLGPLFYSTNPADLLWKYMRFVQPAHVGIYLLAVLVLFQRLSRDVQDRFANVYKHDIVAVRLSLLAFCLVYVVSMAGLLSERAFLFLALSFFIFLGFRSLIHPGLAGGDADETEVSSEPVIAETAKDKDFRPIPDPSATQRAKKSGFRDERVPEYLSRLQSLMLEAKIYEDSTLSLPN